MPQSHNDGSNLHTYIAALRRYAKALTEDPAEADDLVQECLTRAIARVSFWGQIRNVRAYLFSILHNVHVDRVAQKRKFGNVVSLEEVSVSLATPHAQHANLELRDLERALALLPEEQRRVILLVGLEGMTYREAADVLHIPHGTLMSRLFRGRETLRRLMAGETVRNLRRVK
ncbi:MAG: sigma-70 family RNA polymerase sigma factor [Alphaproteobacteria bacterium]|nr:sigma-70 family RNA polymerase sigma factor [Alphaproteobacteria bacterium]